MTLPLIFVHRLAPGRLMRDPAAHVLIAQAKIPIETVWRRAGAVFGIVLRLRPDHSMGVGKMICLSIPML